ncbi:MAG TPA: hypothetical protein VF538_04920 [Pyrinomonadaceae bacterium]|jgi:hypothetical protein
MRHKRLTLLLALSLLVTQTRPALAQAQPAAAAATPQPAAAQKPSAPPQAPLDKRAEKIRRSVQRIGMSQTITVIIAHGDDLHGAITNIGGESFDIAEVDQRRAVTILYADVLKVRSGYAPRPDLFTGQRNSPPKGVRIAAFVALIGTLALPLILIASAKD